MWLLVTLSRILVANGIFPIILKLNVGLPLRTKRFTFMFFFCLVFAIIVANIISPLMISYTTAIILGVGFVNGLAAYAQWRAIDISLSKDSLFTFFDDIIAMGLSYFVLNEGQYLKSWTYVGISLSVGAVIIFTIHSYRRNKSNNSNTTPLRFFLYVGFYSVVWGVAVFLMRYFGVAGLSIGSFLVPWYTGAFIAAVALLLTVKDPAETATNTKLKIGDISWMFLLAILIFVSLALGYKAYCLAPQNIVQPFFLIGEMIFPALIGLYIFSEIKGLDKVEKIVFTCAIIGGIIIAINNI